MLLFKKLLLVYFWKMRIRDRRRYFFEINEFLLRIRGVRDFLGAKITGRSRKDQPRNDKLCTSSPLWRVPLTSTLYFPEIGDAGSSLNLCGGSPPAKVQTRRHPLAIDASDGRIAKSRRGGAIRAVGQPNGVDSENRFLALPVQSTSRRAPTLRCGSL